MLQTMNKRLHNKKGFTLIELIVVIAIIAILAAVLIPRFTGFTKDANEKAAISNARNILVAVEAMLTQGDTDITVDKIEGYTGKAYLATSKDVPGYLLDGTTVITNAASGELGDDTFDYIYVKGGVYYRVQITAGKISTTVASQSTEY